MKKLSTKKIAYLSLLIALQVIFARFLSINAWNIRIGFSFLPVAVASIIFGPLYGGIVGAIGDFVGAILFPTGTYFPGFTLTAFINGLIFGLFLYKKQNWVRVLLAVLCSNIFCTLLLNSLWISVLYGSPFLPLLTTRLVQSAVTAPVQFAVLLVFIKFLPEFKKAIRL